LGALDENSITKGVPFLITEKSSDLVYLLEFRLQNLPCVWKWTTVRVNPKSQTHKFKRLKSTKSQNE
jgi:hypothetical protein